MTDIRILPTWTNGDNVDHMTKLLSAALADGIDLGPRGHHMHALALTLQANLAELHAIAAELGKSPVRDRLRLHTIEADLLKLEECVTKLIAMTKAYGS